MSETSDVSSETDNRLRRAADEIERLQKENQMLKKGMDMWQRAAQELYRQIKQMEAPFEQDVRRQ